MNINKLSLNKDFLEEDEKTWVNAVIFCWYLIHSFGGVYLCYLGLDIFLLSLGVKLPGSLSILFAANWAVVVGLACVIVGLVVTGCSVKTIYKNLLDPTDCC